MLFTYLRGKPSLRPMVFYEILFDTPEQAYPLSTFFTTSWELCMFAAELDQVIVPATLFAAFTYPPHSLYLPRFNSWQEMCVCQRFTQCLNLLWIFSRAFPKLMSSFSWTCTAMSRLVWWSTVGPLLMFLRWTERILWVFCLFTMFLGTLSAISTGITTVHWSWSMKPTYQYGALFTNMHTCMGC